METSTTDKTKLSWAWLRSLIRVVEDFESVDPELYDTKIVYIRDGIYIKDGMAIEELDLHFVDDSVHGEYMESCEFDLKPNGSQIMVLKVPERMVLWLNL